METRWLNSYDTIKLQTKHDHLEPIPVLIYSLCIPAPFLLITHYCTFKHSKNKYLLSNKQILIKMFKDAVFVK